MKIKFLSLFSSIICLCILLASCEKEYSNENGSGSVTLTPVGTSSGTAAYNFSSVSGNCTSPQISGTYATGSATTIANKIVLQVTVVTPGTFLISTATINGIIFTGSGTFTATGVQTIQLFASGTPAVAGSFNYIPGTNGCTYSILFTQGNSNSATFTFPSTASDCNLVTVTGDYIAASALTSSNTLAGIQVNVNAPGTYYLSTVPNNGISFTASGSFTTTGLQTITLTGSGTPITSGTFNYSPGNNGCSFTIKVLPAEPLPTDYIKCKIDGAVATFIDMVSFTETKTPASPPLPATISLDITGNLSAGSNQDFSLFINKTGNSMVNGDSFDANGFATGKIYLVTYRDAAGVSWSAVSGISVASFTITVTTKTATRVQGTFSGTLSDTGVAGGHLKTITEGTFSVPVQ